MEVNYFTQVKVKYEGLMREEYEKANIWPIDNADMGKTILMEELVETCGASELMRDYFLASKQLIPSGFEIENLKGYAVEVILEALQVIAVCNKYKPVFENTYVDVEENKNDLPITD